ncbi:MAG: cell wall hydrolase [Thermoanaerobacteraceae bacterium]|nr:cell wall hydrolase [Thermoanaerobacteraceae bacterium]
MKNIKAKVRRNNMFLLLVLLTLALIIQYLYGQNLATSVFSTWLPLSGKVIVIDPGHGGIDGGTSFNNILEKNINLDVSLKLKRMLEKEGANVIMTRAKDIALDHLNNKNEYRHKRDLISRVDIINNARPDIFLSIHVNAEKSSPKTAGPMVFYYFDSVKSRKLAQILQKSLETAYIEVGHEVSSRRPVGNTSLFILRNTEPPGVIVEMGFITNSWDRQLLTTQDFQKKLSKAIVIAVKEYFS